MTSTPQVSSQRPGANRTSDFVLFGILGSAAFLFSIWLGLNLLDIAGRFLGQEQLAYARQPAWLKSLRTVIPFVPWILCIGVAVHSIRKRRWMPLVAFAGALLLGSAVVIALLVCGPVVADYAARVPFDVTAWQAENRPHARGARVQMVDDLMRKHRLVGMRRDEVEGLLGVPPRTNYFSEYDYVYWLGPERGLFSIDSEWLVLKFKDNVVTRAAVLTD